MKFIEECLTRSTKDKKATTIGSIFAVIFFFTIPFILIPFSGSKLFGLAFFLTVFTIPPLGFLLGMKLSKKILKKQTLNFKTTKLYKQIEKQENIDKFINTINDEIYNINTIRYYDEIYENGLFITENWFVFLDLNKPKIIKTKEILQISSETTNEMKKYIRLKLKDGTIVNTRPTNAFKDIEKEIKFKYPNIEIVKKWFINEAKKIKAIWYS